MLKLQFCKGSLGIFVLEKRHLSVVILSTKLPEAYDKNLSLSVAQTTIFVDVFRGCAVARRDYVVT